MDIAEKTYENILEHIRVAKDHALCRGIKANTVIIDKGLAVANNIYKQFDFLDSMHCEAIQLPPIILGLEVKYQTNLSKDLGANFIITEGNTVESELDRLRKENKELRSQLEQIKRVVDII